jgi:ankyrin repeat protein
MNEQAHDGQHSPSLQQYQQALQQIQQQQEQIQQLQQQNQQLQQQNQQLLPLQQLNQLLRQQNQDQEQQIEEHQEQQAEEIESDDDDGEDEEEDDDPLAMGNAMFSACEGVHLETIVSLLDAGKNVNCINSSRTTPIMYSLYYWHLHVAIMLVGRGADLSWVNNDGSNVLHYAAGGGNCECIEWVLANTSIDVNSTDSEGWTPIIWALNNNRLDAGKLLVEKGANLFNKSDNAESAIDLVLGPQVLQHAKDLIWESVKPLLLLSSACSTSTPSTSLIKVFSISGLV